MKEKKCLMNTSGHEHYSSVETCLLKFNGDGEKKIVKKCNVYLLILLNLFTSKESIELLTMFLPCIKRTASFEGSIHFRWEQFALF